MTTLTKPTEFIVITGGPGAGKTALLELLRKVVCEHVAILPEAAGILFGGGFWRLNSLSAKKAGQKAIFYVQQEMENLISGENKWSLGLCDRGLLDGLAYWPGPEAEFYKTLQTERDHLYERYKAVIHLKSPSLEQGYNNDNPIRIETAEQAAEIDAKIYTVWSSHPNYHLIEPSDSFLDKVNHASKIVQGFTPHCCRSHF